MLDCRDFTAVGIAAARIHAMNTAASCILSGSSLPDRLERESIADYLIEAAAAIAREIAKGADRAEFEQSVLASGAAA